MLLKLARDGVKSKLATAGETKRRASASRPIADRTCLSPFKRFLDKSAPAANRIDDFAKRVRVGSVD